MQEFACNGDAPAELFINSWGCVGVTGGFMLSKVINELLKWE